MFKNNKIKDNLRCNILIQYMSGLFIKSLTVSTYTRISVNQKNVGGFGYDL